MKMKRGLAVPPVPSIGHQKAELIALELVADFQPERLREAGPFNVARWFEFHLPKKYKLNTGVGDMPIGVEGFTIAEGNGGLIRLSQSAYDGMLDGRGHDRFTAAHEGVHGIRHLRTIQSLHCEITAGKRPTLYRRSDIPSYLNPEWQASRIASAILMPWTTLRRLLDKYGEDITLIATTFQVSPSAVIVRLDQLRRMGRRW